MLTDSLIGHIDNAVAQAGFADVYKNRLNASHVRHLYTRISDLVVVPYR